MSDDVWFVYDGQCPICSNVAKAYKIKKAVGNLHALDARENKNHPLMQEINALHLDIDQGMVIKFQNTLYHGVDALHVMALLGTDSGLFNKINSTIFKSKILAKIFYPTLRTLRNFVLWSKGIKKIKNLENV